MSYETNDKMVSHPDHYQSGKYEVIDIIDEFTKDLRGTEAVCTANAIKYILRWKKKNGIQDVQKAIWYLQHMVDKEEERLREEHAEFDEERLEKIINHPTFVDIQSIKDNTKYTKEVDLSTGKVTVTPQTCEEIHSCDDCASKYNEPFTSPCIECDLHSNPHSKWKKEVKEFNKFIGDELLKKEKEVEKLEPGCDRCEISECKFLEDPFMNPPYNELWSQWKAQKEIINDLLRDKKEMQDSIDILEDDKKILKEIIDDSTTEKEEKK